MQGHEDSPLTQNGVTQANNVRMQLPIGKIAAIYSSDLGRCANTARIIASGSRLKINFTKKLREIDVGEFTGLTKLQLKEKFPEFAKERNKNTHTTPYLNGESYEDVEERIKGLIKKIQEKHSNQTVLLVTHQTTSRNIIAYLLDLPRQEIVKIHHPNNCIYKIDTESKKIWNICNNTESEGCLLRSGEI
jgi:probable phosphoglycerate mutase